MKQVLLMCRTRLLAIVLMMLGGAFVQQSYGQLITQSTGTGTGTTVTGAANTNGGTTITIGGATITTGVCTTGNTGITATGFPTLRPRLMPPRLPIWRQLFKLIQGSL